jgi:hypothetical protein
MARADESIRRAAAAGRATTEAAMAAAAKVPAPGTTPGSTAGQGPGSIATPAGASGRGADRAAGEPRPAPGIAGRPTSEQQAGPDAARAELAGQLAGAMRSIPGIERFGRLRLAELDRAGSTTLKSLWRNARSDLEASYGQLTIAEILARFADTEGPAPTRSS